MAIFHLAVKSVSRSTGRSAVAAVAYRAGVLLENERDGLVHDYTRRNGVEDTLMAVPEGAEWALDRSALWNAAEAAEKRKDAKVAREYELALPAELDADQRRDLVRAFAEDIRDRYGVAVDAAIHAPHDYGDDRNYHAHVMTTTRVVEPDGLGAKTRQLDVRTSASAEVEAIRESWAERVNVALEHALVPERVDHRSYARQGIEQEPTVKMGHASAAIERRAAYEQQMAGEEPHAVTPRGQMNEAIEAKRGLGLYIERGLEWLQEAKQQAELVAHNIADLAREAAQMMRARLRGPEDGFEALPGLDQSPRREHVPAIEQDRSVQVERDRQQERERQRSQEPDIGFGR
ncbi:MobQ family relaxase [Sphingomonas sp. BAUL-RG-20F-R05-02]|uniref:MobQ family relaxase n=1 Tax=Sphingomonas sp. BAUL-RG-20F-R05-02 TaxID=2914830 RepID=UPI001F56FDDF|nr:MobQ family relaxase [Sphingomonas sp. BAUL-RG-20F-R05-02]